MTAFYSFRMYFLVFHGKERYDQNPMLTTTITMADDHHGHDAKPHETPWVVTVTLVLLAILSVVMGFRSSSRCCSVISSRTSFCGCGQASGPWNFSWPNIFHGPWEMALHGLKTVLCPGLLWRCGNSRTYMYMVNPTCLRHRACVFKDLPAAGNKYGMDWINENILPGCPCTGTGSVEGGDQA